MHTILPAPLFVYGTLRDRQVLATVLGRPVAGRTLHDASAPGWCAVFYPGETYPALIPAKGDAAPGLLITDVSADDLARLDVYEGNQYARKAILVMCGEQNVLAEAYLPVIEIAPDAPRWAFAAWTKSHRKATIADELAMAKARAYDRDKIGNPHEDAMIFERDEYETANGPLTVIPVHHATFVMEWNGEVIYCDPVGDPARYAALERPTLIVLTHHHGDHLSLETLDALIDEETILVAPQIVFDKMPPDIAARTRRMANGDTGTINGIGIRAIPMYNTTLERAKYHEKGVGNGYLLDFSGTRVYLASDTEPTDAMDDLGPVEIAFFPMNLPYTMTPDQVVTAIGKVRPRFAYPFHYRYPFDEIGTEPEALIALMPADSQTKVLARNWYPDF
jgi:L-ascorbate metabolism protein UlaG (beta-lactamase superfamily)/gamma-glutamylcyclotransferase (GGCT)/AIG2-like uncharacterized protein YtfP